MTFERYHKQTTASKSLSIPFFDYVTTKAKMNWAQSNFVTDTVDIWSGYTHCCVIFRSTKPLLWKYLWPLSLIPLSLGVCSFPFHWRLSREAKPAQFCPTQLLATILMKNVQIRLLFVRLSVLSHFDCLIVKQEILNDSLPNGEWFFDKLYKKIHYHELEFRWKGAQWKTETNFLGWENWRQFIDKARSLCHIIFSLDCLCLDWESWKKSKNNNVRSVCCAPFLSIASALSRFIAGDSSFWYVLCPHNWVLS